MSFKTSSSSSSSSFIHVKSAQLRLFINAMSKDKKAKKFTHRTFHITHIVINMQYIRHHTGPSNFDRGYVWFCSKCSLSAPLKGLTQLALGLSWDSQVRCWSEKYVTVSVKAPSVSLLIKYSTSKLTGVQNYKSQLVPIGLVNLWRFIACGLVNTVDLILPSLNVRWTFE